MTTEGPPGGEMHSGNADDWVDAELEAIRDRHLLRRTVPRPGAGGKFHEHGDEILNFSSNDYLNLSGDPRLREAASAATARYGAGATASRLVSGTLACHDELEQRLATHKGYPAALVFGSGYLANVGTIPTLIGHDDHAFTDRLAHASMIDGIRLSGARHHRFHHNDVGHLTNLLAKAPQRGRKLVLTESIFSMDGDAAPLAEITETAARHGAMILVDEAHSGGVFGPRGAGRVAELGLSERVHICMGTLSKALGGYGGFVACSSSLRDLLVNRARSFIYTTGLPPAAVATGLAALDILEREPDLGERLLERSRMFRQNLNVHGIDSAASESQIIPVLIGESEDAVAAADELARHHLLAVAMRPPTVPPGTARLRLSVTLAHEPDDLVRAADRITQCTGCAAAPS